MKLGCRALALAVLCCPTVSQVLPTGFFSDTLATMDQPVGLAFLPDGRVFVIEQRTGAIRVWAGGATAGLVGTVSGVLASQTERGLLAIAVDPQWPARPYVYVWFNSSTAPNMVLAMYPISGDLTNASSTNLVLGSRYNIVTDIPDNAINHNGGTLRFGIDGKLYLSIGDDANSCAAQDPSSSLGCIWRIDVSSLPGVGTGPPLKSTLIPSGNPFAGPTDNARLVWAYGLRNPFRFHIDSVTGGLYIADVGEFTLEEIDENTTGGQNFGWPWFEGTQVWFGCGGASPPSVGPIATWSHTSGAQAIISLGRYRNPTSGPHSFGLAYEGDYFYLDYTLGAIRRLRSNGNAWVTPPVVPGQPNANDWASGFDTVADALVGPDGALYYVRQFPPGFAGPGSLGRIRGTLPTLSIVSGNNQPGNAGRALQHPLVARLTTNSGASIAGGTVNFSPIAGGGSTNPPSAITDAQGNAQTGYTLSPSYTAEPVIAAGSPGVASANFDVRWRGIVASYDPFVSSFSITVRHSQVNSPFLLCWETPPAGAPYGSTPFGDVWTSVLSPQPGFNYADGLGLLGPPDPAFKTGAASATWTAVVSPVPPFGGVPFLFQAYAIDSALYPAPESIMISNPFTVTLN